METNNNFIHDIVENDIKKEGYPVYKKYEEALENAINMVLKII